MEEELYTPYLIQRISSRRDPADRPDKKGVDSQFSFDYMGSAEFEFGCLFKALKRMRETADNRQQLLSFEIGSHKFWYVGLVDEFKVAEKIFEDQLSKSPKMRFKEFTGISSSVDGSEKYCRSIGWWAVDETSMMVPWAVFIKREDADAWVDLAYAPKA